MTRDDKEDLRALRDDCDDEETKKLLRKAINYIEDMEKRIQTIGVFARSIAKEVKGQ